MIFVVGDVPSLIVLMTLLLFSIISLAVVIRTHLLAKKTFRNLMMRLRAAEQRLSVAETDIRASYDFRSDGQVDGLYSTTAGDSGPEPLTL